MSGGEATMSGPLPRRIFSHTGLDTDKRRAALIYDPAPPSWSSVKELLAGADGALPEHKKWQL
jgi:hypothetical protein